MHEEDSVNVIETADIRLRFVGTVERDERLRAATKRRWL
jgi:hypothetical protein